MTGAFAPLRSPCSPRWRTVLSFGARKIETAILLPDGWVFANTIGCIGQHDVFADETAWLRAVEAHWRKETGERVLKALRAS